MSDKPSKIVRKPCPATPGRDMIRPTRMTMMPARFFPILMQLLGLVTGLIQAYIFAVLAMVYIASAASVRGRRGEGEETASEDS